jgi:mannose/fructose/N-acetylgalactosamine-specific phosphotransferase system component IID
MNDNLSGPKKEKKRKKKKKASSDVFSRLILLNAAAAGWHIQAVGMCFMMLSTNNALHKTQTGNLKTNASIKFHLGFLSIFLLEMVG